MNEKAIIPKSAWITVNRACNFRCKWCYAKGSGYNNKNTASLEYVKRVLNILKKINVQNVLLIGGEPTIWKPLLEFNQYAKDLKIKTTIVTNGARFANDDFWQKYTMCPNTSGGVSVKGYSKENLKDLADYNSFEGAKKGIVRGLGLWRNGASVVYNALCADNLVDLAKFIMDCGAGSMNVSPCTPSFESNWVDSKYVIHPEEMVKKIVRDYDALDQVTRGRISFFLKLPLCIWPREFLLHLMEKKQITTVCQLQQRAGLIFDDSGNIMMCNGLFSYPIGKLDQDFSDASGLVDFINQPKINGIYDQINSYSSEKCVNCPMFKQCGGGCPLFWSVFDPSTIIKGWN